MAIRRNIQFARQLSVGVLHDLQVLPFFMFYRGADGLLASFSASVSKVQRLRYALAVNFARGRFAALANCLPST